MQNTERTVRNAKTRRLVASLVCVCSLAVASQAAAGEKGLLGHWKFDEAGGDVVVDSSGNQNDGEIWGAQWVKGKFGTALWFDGSGAYVSIPEIAGLDGSDEMTVETWVYWEGTGRYPNVITGGTWSPGGFMIFVSDTQCSFRMGRPDFSASKDKQQWQEISSGFLTPFKEGRWYHLAATFKETAHRDLRGRQRGRHREMGLPGWLQERRGHR